MPKKPSVLVAMSGGVDSSVAAALLQQAGYDCTGVFMCFGQTIKESEKQRGCCDPQAARDAERVAAKLGIAFEVLDLQRELDGIIDYFVDEYRRARTPNPCIVCNSRLKFGKLIEYACMINIDYVATGHYAQIRSVDGHKRLCRAVDIEKDQSYALFNLTRESLNKVLLPLGQYPKSRVRQLASEMNLPVHDKGESQEICFVPDDDYARLVVSRSPEPCQPGPVLDAQGNKLGEHGGIFRYTIGQRRGLGIALGEPAYVIRLDAATNTVVLGSREQLLQRRLWASGVNWLIEPAPTKPFTAMVQIRYNHRGQAALVTPRADKDGRICDAVVDFDKPISAITPGQAAVFYVNQAVLGGGWIDKGEN